MTQRKPGTEWRHGLVVRVFYISLRLRVSAVGVGFTNANALMVSIRIENLLN